MKFDKSQLLIYAVTDRSWTGNISLYEQTEAALKDKILGVTAKTVEQALKAQSQGADYLGSGAVFGTSTKKDARPMTMEQLQAICASVSIPVVAIGGICLDNIEKLKGSGAVGAAIVSGIFAAQDIEATTRELREKMERNLLEK